MTSHQSPVTSHSRGGYLPAVRMITEGDTPEMARSLAADAERDGMLIKVCSWCMAKVPEVKRAVAGFANLSHGCCLVCAAEQLAGLAEGRGKGEAPPAITEEPRGGSASFPREVGAA